MTLIIDVVNNKKAKDLNCFLTELPQTLYTTQQIQEHRSIEYQRHKVVEAHCGLKV